MEDLWKIYGNFMDDLWMMNGWWMEDLWAQPFKYAERAQQSGAPSV